MKNILVPTDFSIYAKYATEMAMNLAERFDATLHLFSTLDIPAWNINSASKKEKAAYQESLQLIHNTEQLFREWKEKAARRSIDLKTFWAGGKLTETILQYQKSNNIDLLVMGSHGTTANLNSVLGSNTQRVVRKLHCPVFVVKNPVKKVFFKNIVFASRFQESEKEDLVRFLQFIKPFQPDVIHLLHIDTSSWFTQPFQVQEEVMEDFKKEVEKLTTCQTHFYRDYSVDAGIRHFADEVKADLIVISNHHRRPLKRTLVGSKVEDLIRATDLPMLSFDYSIIRTQEINKLPT